MPDSMDPGCHGENGGSSKTISDDLKLLANEIKEVKSALILKANERKEKSWYKIGWEALKALSSVGLITALSTFFTMSLIASEDRKSAELIASKDRKAEALQKQKNYYISLIENDISEQKKSMKSLKKVLVDIRRIDASIKNNCRKPDKYLAKDKEAHINETYKLIDEATGLGLIFNKPVFDAVIGYSQYVQSIKDLCGKDIPTDNEWRNHQRKVTHLILDLRGKERLIMIDIIKSTNIKDVNKIYINYMKLRNFR